MPWVIHRAFEGDFTPIADFLIRWRANGSFDGLYLSITCAEDVPFIAADAAERDEPTYLGSYRVREQRAACAGTHGLHFGWVEQGSGRYRAHLAIYVKPRGVLGETYMKVIEPFRHLVVYPALMRQIEPRMARGVA